MPQTTVNGVSLNYLEIPQRPGMMKPGAPVVMIHGLAASSAFWYLAGAEFLSVLGPCLAYDLRGHGKSSAPDVGYSVTNMVRDLEGLLDDRGIKVADFVAHSFGGMIALLFALNNPDRVRSLVLVDVRVRPLQHTIDVSPARVPPGIINRLTALGLDVNKLQVADDGIGYLESVARIQILAEQDAGELLNALYQHPRLFRTAKSARRWIELTERASLVADLEGEFAFEPGDLIRLDQPILILVGERSTTRPSAEAVARICRNAELRIVPGVGHFFPIAKPKLFLRPTLRFLRALRRER